ncbi:MAG TPA: hypothetical protein PLJ83_11450 [Spirochaetales bacterium]|nr:hypothetical protein [Spirochaetales bacterium]
MTHKTRTNMDHGPNYFKILFITVGGYVGFLIKEFKPTFPLMIIVIIFILYDTWTAYQLNKRASEQYPDKVKKENAKFKSFSFAKVIRLTIPKRLILIILAYLVEHWVFVYMDVPLSYIVAGIICFEQAWSILENESSCRGEKEGMFWRLLQKIMIDKTERHFDVNLDELKDKIDTEKEK